ncbi:MAG: PQQ-binding-like beta-propeller repeat protein [Phycisphaeraceae bacterium]
MIATRRFVYGLTLAATLVGAIGPAYGLRQVQMGPGAMQFELQAWDGPWLVENPTPAEEALPGFNVAASGKAIGDTPAGEALEHMRAGEWVKAIQAIESLDTADPTLVVDSRGILRPLSSLKSALIAALPDAGRRAFRQLNDPAAKTRLDRALAIGDLNRRAESLAGVVRDYPICDASARAADALGDLRFEQGRFDEAAQLYRLCADHPGYPGDRAMLTAKRLMALARAESWRSFDDLAEYAVFSESDRTLKLGGQAIAMRDLIEQLVQDKGTRPDKPRIADRALPLPDLAAPAFDRWLIDPRLKRSLNNQTANPHSGARLDAFIEPVVVADAQRLFTLSLASIARLDPQTGSELWRLGDPARHAVQHNLQHQISRGSYQQALIPAGDVLIAVSPDQHMLERSNSATQSNLIALDADTGETLWKFDRIQSQFNHHNVVGRPLVHAGTIYAVMQRAGNPTLTLAAIRLSDGRLESALELGGVSMNPHSNQPVLVSPRLAMGRDLLFVQTNSGGLIAIDPANNAIAWAFTEPMNAVVSHGVSVPSPSSAGELVARDGLVVTKDAGSGTVFAFREHDAALAWSTKADQDAAIVHADARHVYLLGDELVALDRKTGEPAWWTSLPGQRAGQPVFTPSECLVAGDRRFCRIDLTTGRLTDFRDDGEGGADLTLVGDTLIQTTGDSIVGHRLPD